MYKVRVFLSKAPIHCFGGEDLGREEDHERFNTLAFAGPVTLALTRESVEINHLPAFAGTHMGANSYQTLPQVHSNIPPPPYCQMQSIPVRDI